MHFSLQQFNLIMLCRSEKHCPNSPPALPLPLHQEPRPRWRSAPAAGRVSFGRKEHVCWSPVHGRELAKAVHAAGRSSAAGAHVHDSAAL